MPASSADGAGAARIVGSAVSGASLLAGAQLVSRLATFALNVLLARAVQDPSALGVAAVQLYLLDTLALTLAREGVRRTSLRASGEGAADARLMARLSWAAVLVGLAGIVPLCWYWLRSADAGALGGVSLGEYQVAVWLMGLSVALELLSEPMFVAAQGRLEYGARSAIEAVAVGARCMVQFIGVVHLGLGLRAFAWGYVAYSVCLLLGYAAHSLRRAREVPDGSAALHLLLPCGARPAGFASGSLEAARWRLAASLSVQQFAKVVLAEGEKMVMMGMSMAAADQAVYSLVSNLGSLVVRFLFLPIEESAFAVFGKLNDLAARRHEHEHENEQEEKTPRRPQQQQQHDASLSLDKLVSAATRVMALVGLVFVTFGPPYSHLLLRLLYGERWSDGTEAAPVLALYCAYLVLVAVNGITEAFVHAVGSAQALKSLNAWLMLFSLAYVVAAVALFHLRARGLILANMLSMLLRIAFSVHFITRWRAPGSGVAVRPAALAPSVLSFAGFAAAALATRASERALYGARLGSLHAAAAHVAVGAACLAALAALLALVSEKQLASDLRQLHRVVKRDGAASNKQA
jgi:oligosaccharide translocation protein RFT1